MKARLLLIGALLALSSCSVHHNVLLQRRCGGSISMPVVEIRPKNESGDAFLVLMTGAPSTKEWPTNLRRTASRPSD